MSEDKGSKKLVCSGQRREGMQEDCIGSQVPQRRVVLQKEKLNSYGLLTKFRAEDVVTFVTACYIIMM